MTCKYGEECGGTGRLSMGVTPMEKCPPCTCQTWDGKEQKPSEKTDMTTVKEYYGDRDWEDCPNCAFKTNLSDGDICPDCGRLITIEEYGPGMMLCMD